MHFREFAPKFSCLYLSWSTHVNKDLNIGVPILFLQNLGLYVTAIDVNIKEFIYLSQAPYRKIRMRLRKNLNEASILFYY